MVIPLCTGTPGQNQTSLEKKFVACPISSVHFLASFLSLEARLSLSPTDTYFVAFRNVGYAVHTQI